MTQPTYRKQALSLPSLSFKDADIRYIKILTAPERSKRVDEKDDGRQPAITCRVLNLVDGEEYILVCPMLMVTALSDTHTDPVGKCFEVIAPREIRPGKNYKDVTLYEIDCTVDYAKMPETLDNGS